jgi:S1-C subfamily serine protease
MARIQDALLQSVIYIYKSEADAWKGERAGGTGFLVGYPSLADPKACDLYAVTNRHVVEEGQARTIRLNTKEGGVDVMAFSRQDWITHPDGEDLAACAIQPSEEKHTFSFFTTEWFVTEEIIRQVNIGPGDDAMVLGRFVNHEGNQMNQPSARFGHISMMPGDLVKQENGHMQLSFMVEAHSTGGYSGSPVFVHIAQRRPGIFSAGLTDTWFLGVDWGHIVDWQPLIVESPRKSHPEGWGFPVNTGLIGVVPAWQLRDLLDNEEFVKLRTQR